jgi:hypothetical protein
MLAAARSVVFSASFRLNHKTNADCGSNRIGVSEIPETPSYTGDATSLPQKTERSYALEKEHGAACYINCDATIFWPGRGRGGKPTLDSEYADLSRGGQYGMTDISVPSR